MRRSTRNGQDNIHITGSAAIIKGLKKSLRYIKKKIDLAAVTHER